MKPDLPAIEARAANMVGVLGWWGPVPKTIRQDMLDLLEYIKELEREVAGNRKAWQTACDRYDELEQKYDAATGAQ